MSQPTSSKQQIPGYQILEKLGAGGMATVYKARQISLDRVVAIKVLPKKFTSNPEYVKRLYAEGRAAAKLNHANIVGALDVGQAGDFHFFVMEYVEGNTAYDELMEAVRYDEEDAVRIMLQIARGLAHAHSAGIVHHDVKPQNIMLTDEGVAKLADMGLARQTSAEAGGEEGQNKVLGTPYYISPEQILNKPDIDFRADIYSFGATLYYMVAGQVPFDAPTPQQVMRKHLNEPLTPPIKVNARLSQGLSDVICVCMAKSAGDRYESTEDLVADLEAISHGEMPLRAQSILGANHQPDEELDAEPKTSADVDIEAPPPVTKRERDPLVTQPMFWVALVGWGVALLFMYLWWSARSAGV